MPTVTPCPCGSPDYTKCCSRYHAGAPVPDAAALMRARYSAYAMKLDGFVTATWHPSTRPDDLDLQGDSARWINLKVLAHQIVDANHATVEFVARYRIAGRASRLHEKSNFVREAGIWYYVDGHIHED